MPRVCVNDEGTEDVKEISFGRGAYALRIHLCAPCRARLTVARALRLAEVHRSEPTVAVYRPVSMDEVRAARRAHRRSNRRA